MRTKHHILGLAIIMLIISSSCFAGTKKVDYSKQGVCIVADASIRAEANKNGKWLSSLAVGETVILEGNPVKDPKDPKTEYVKVRLSDGTKGFVNAWCLVRGAYVAVAHRSAKIYKRPDLLADSKTSFEMLDVVAIDEEKADWIHATGENRAKSGWIERTAIRKAKEDIVTAVLLRKALRGKEKTITRVEVEKIVADLPNPNNYFAVKILQKYQMADNVEQNEAATVANTVDTAEETDTPENETEE